MLKTKRAENILKPLMAHLNKFKEVSENNEDSLSDISSKKSLIVEHFHRLINIMFDEFSSYPNDKIANVQSIKSKLIEMFNELFSMKPNEATMNKFLDEFNSAVAVQERIECYVIKRQIEAIHNYVKEISQAQQIEHILNIKELATKLWELFQLLVTYGKNLISHSLKEKIILCINQLYISFTMLSNLVKEQHKLKLPIHHTKKYLCDRICICLDKITEVLDAPHPTVDEENDEKDNHFVYKMDLVLDLLSELSAEQDQNRQIIQCAKLWPVIEEVFSHAMSIAQVCQPENFEAITNICQIIISEYENLKNQLSSVPREVVFNGLFIKTTTDALYRLERQVNISVLTLVKDVFSDPFCALAKIIDMCGSSLPPERRTHSDIAADFEHFDEMSDEIMQIGFYATACCRDVNRVTKIKNIMASLESIELELIPTITMFYLNPQNEELRAGAKLLTDQWQKDVREFRATVEMIIDPAAFCQVVLDDLEERIKKMNYCLDHHIPIMSCDIKTFVLRACTLAMQITFTINDIGEDEIDKQTIMMIRELKAAVYEASAAEKRFRSIVMTNPEQLRVIKRCEWLVNVVKRLQPALITVMNDWDSMNSVNISKQIGGDHSASVANSSLIKTPYTVASFKSTISIQPADVEQKTLSQRSCLIPYIKQGRTMRTNRSILYRNSTLRHVKQFQRDDLSCVRQHLFSRDSSIASQSQELDWKNVSYDLTTILSELSLDNSKVVGNNTETNEVTGVNSSAIGGGDAPSAIETPQRIADIQQLNKRIDLLQKHKLTSK